jgi:hypothetical protein
VPDPGPDKTGTFKVRPKGKLELNMWAENGELLGSFDITKNVRAQNQALTLTSTTAGQKVSIDGFLMSAIEFKLSEVEIRSWLENYQQALEEKDVDKLVKLGVYSRQDTDIARDILSGYGDFRVALQNVDIHIEGGSATVTFTRRDTINGRSMLPFDQTFTVEKKADGRITVAGRG